MDNKREVARLRRKVSKWLKEWVVMPYMHETFRAKPPRLFKDYLDGNYKSAFLSLRTGEIHLWHYVNYQQAVLNEGEDGLADLALAVRYAEAYVRFEEAFADVGKGGSVLLTDATLYFSLTVIAGWKDSAHRIGKTLVKGLDTSLLDLRHTDKHRKGRLFRSFWFVMHLYESSGQRFDISKYSYPEDMSPYAQVLADWQTRDLDKVQGWVSAMADYHIREARNTAHDEVAEFDIETAMIFPYEILCWLRLREWAGLENPQSFDHPLMQQPLARLPQPVPLPQPQTPLLDEVIAKFKLEYPDSFN